MEDIKKVVEGAEAYVKPSMEVIDLGQKNDILTGSIPEEKEIEIPPTPVTEVTQTPESGDKLVEEEWDLV